MLTADMLLGKTAEEVTEAVNRLDADAQMAAVVRPSSHTHAHGHLRGRSVHAKP